MAGQKTRLDYGPGGLDLPPPPTACRECREWVNQTWLPVRSRREPVRWRPHRLHEHRRGSVQDDGGQDGHQDGAVRLQVAQR